jgi:hypothetical protein
MRHGNPYTYCYFYHHSGDSYTLMVFKTFSTQEITSIIKSIKTKNSSGYDEISTKLLKISANYICSLLSYICNKSVSTGIFPERLKYSVIKPLYRMTQKTGTFEMRCGSHVQLAALRNRDLQLQTTSPFSNRG